MTDNNTLEDLNNLPGKFIVFEGCDGSGKTTIINKLKKHFKDNKKVLFIKEPGSTELGECIRDILLSNKSYNKEKELAVQTQFYLFMAARIELIDKIILPKLKEGYTIICDRFALSSWVYQNNMDNSLSGIIKQAMIDLEQRIKVDQTFYLSITASEAKSRIDNEDRKDSNNKFDDFSATFYGNIILWYNMGLLGVEFPKNLLGTIENIDASKSPKDVFDEVVNKINI